MNAVIPLIEEMQDKLACIREALEEFESLQNDDSDEGNEDHISGAMRALDSLEGHVGDLVP